MAFTQDFRTQRRNYDDGETRIGEKDRLWYDSNTNSIRIGDGATPGGVIVGGSGGGSDYILPTASTTVKGGVKVDGTTITIANQVISATQQDLSSYATQTYVTTRGYLTSSALTDYALTSAIPTNNNQLTNGAGYLTSYTETDPIFVAHAAHNVTNTKITNWDTAYGWGNHASAGYLTSSALSGYALTSAIPTNTNELTNGAGFITTSDLSGYLTATNDGTVTLQSSDTASLRWLDPDGGGAGLPYDTTVSVSDSGVMLRATSGVINVRNIKTWYFDATGSITFPDSTVQTTAFTGPQDLSSYATQSYVTSQGYITSSALSGYALTSAIPTNNNQLTNGAGYITSSALSGYATESYVTSRGYLTSVAASALTGTTLASGVTASSLTSVGTLSSLTTSGTGINVSTHGKLYDDGNFHIHSVTGSLWLNAEDNNYIEINTQTSGGVKLGNDVQSRTPYKARTAWNAAIGTVIVLDNYQYRVVNSGGIFPQVQSEILGDVNTSWVSVATISGAAITQTGNTGILLTTWTNLYSAHGLDAAGDMVVTTITDKAHGIVHRVTFIRNDDGANTGYSIFAEKLW